MIYPDFGHIFPLLIGLVILLVPAWRIVTKAGYHGAFSLLLFVPLVNLVMIWVFAFSTWPAERRNQEAGNPVS